MVKETDAVVFWRGLTPECSAAKAHSQDEADPSGKPRLI